MKIKLPGPLFSGEMILRAMRDAFSLENARWRVSAESTVLGSHYSTEPVKAIIHSQRLLINVEKLAEWQEKVWFRTVTRSQWRREFTIYLRVEHGRNYDSIELKVEQRRDGVRSCGSNINHPHQKRFAEFRPVFEQLLERFKEELLALSPPDLIENVR